MVTVNSSNSNNSNSTQLIETVSIDYDDFNDAFLTCATCLCVYDGSERAPKLLPCSHTVCVHCLTRIAAAATNRRITQDTSSNNGRNSGNNIIQSQQQEDSQTVQRQTFRCPICRELIVVPPNGGVSALPPSFLVNQLLDLISTHRRRTLIPTCCGGGVLPSHMNQELLYCETCDQVFCSICTKHESIDGSNLISSKSSSVVHTIIPVSIAMKRTSEIMLYKANACVVKLNCSKDGVRAELDRLDTARNECLATLDETFGDLMNIIENRKQQLQQQIHKACDAKNKILSHQLTAIENEKTKVMDECSNVHQLLDVQSINQRIQMLDDRLQQPTGGVDEPRENAFITLDLDLTAIKDTVNNTIGQMGRVRTTTTCPGHCTLDFAELNGENLVIPRLVDTKIATLTAVDYDGNQRTLGGDPVTVKLIPLSEDIDQDRTISNLEHQLENNIDDGVRVIDHDNGQYTIRLRLSSCGRYRLSVLVLGRPVTFNCNTGHVDFSITKNNDPICRYNKGPSMQQPAAIAIDPLTSKVYVLDTGNCRIRVLDTNLNYICDIQNTEALRGRSSTGIGLLCDETLVTVNWRTNTVTRMMLSGETVNTWTHSNMVEPMCIAVDRTYDHVLIGDSSCNVHAFKAATGQHLFTINSNNSNGKSAECVGTFIAIGPQSQIVLISPKSTTGCRCLDVFNCKGTYERTISINAATDKSARSYSSLAICNSYILATRRHHNSYVIDLINIDTGKLINTVDSNACKLRRPAGLVAVTELQDTLIKNGEHLQCPSYYLFVTDVAADSVNKYRFY